MRALVIGTGWFGCEVAATLESLGIEFDMLDKNNAFFSESSSKNQNRLHFGGFHYCRSFDTRDECRKGYINFMDMYPSYSDAIDSFYVVAAKSVLDYRTYKSIFEHEGSEFETMTLSELRDRGIDLNNSFVDGFEIMVVKERWINFEKVKNHFASRFGGHLKMLDRSLLHVSEDGNRVYYDDISYDIAFDCTYGKLFPFEKSVFEVCLTLVYRRKDDRDNRSPAVTVVDGDFFSLYPYKKSLGLYTLTHVKYTPMFQTHSVDDAYSFVDQVCEKAVRNRRSIIEDDVSKAYVNFLNTHEYSSHFVSLKTKFMDVGCADRSTRVKTNGNVISMCGGKITGACEIRNTVENFVKNKSLSTSRDGAKGACSVPDVHET